MVLPSSQLNRNTYKWQHFWTWDGNFAHYIFTYFFSCCDGDNDMNVFMQNIVANQIHMIFQSVFNKSMFFSVCIRKKIWLPSLVGKSFGFHIKWNLNSFIFDRLRHAKKKEHSCNIVIYLTISKCVFFYLFTWFSLFNLLVCTCALIYRNRFWFSAKRFHGHEVWIITFRHWRGLDAAF